MSGEVRPSIMARWPAHVTGALILASFAAALATGYWMRYPGWGFVGFLVLQLAVGWFLAARVPWNSLGWLMLTITALFAVQVPADLVGRALLESDPHAAAWLLWFGHDRTPFDAWWPMLPVGIMLTQIPLRFPTGRLPSPRWRAFSVVTIALLVMATAILSTNMETAYPGVPSPVHVPWYVGGIPAQYFVISGVYLVAITGSFASVIARYRHGDLQVRAQLKWMLWAVIVNVPALTYPLYIPQDFEVLNQSFLLVHALLPIAILVAILRYHLYEIDRVISRTAAYALVSLLLLGVYAVVVTSTTWILPGAPSLAVALATLIAAALFLPVLRWIRRRVDRRFDREQYDAQRVVDAFGEHLRAEVDPAATTKDLLSVVETALQPRSLGVWAAPVKR